jgi:hypothetical protein
MTKWEEEKRHFKPRSSALQHAGVQVYITLPLQLLQAMDHTVLEALEQETGYDDRIPIPREQMMSFFKPQIDEVRWAGVVACHHW